MKKFIFLLLTVFGLGIQGQTYRFIYELQYKSDSTNDHLDKINLVLDVNPKEVKFYEYDYLKADSINRVNGNYEYVYGGRFESVKRARNSFKNQIYELIGEDMYSYPAEDKMIWKLSNETKNFGGYSLQKATTHFGGRDWTAWFTKDINISEGPYKFCGLPGMIFQLEDSKSNFIFTLIKSKNLKETYDTVGFIETFFGRKPLEISEKVRTKKRLEMYNDPLIEMRKSFKENSGGQMIVMGTKITNIEQFKDLTQRIQEYFKKNNNPIDLDKAVRY
ncbi:GLPGLI family protein [Chryseobacterium sp. MEBOG06]|uniref:GLPGLI family protein n=1 Tax=Chryseobacterium sp. MEBOG06 TaxID=2879938 RepID=UPI001F46B681|nr:GLPGLI family protein [Chryseobacterium sp. MEBOG06]UKB84398.1 GLPGLI family protein [Chryseobacterium sp. MEBOG06]